MSPRDANGLIKTARSISEERCGVEVELSLCESNAARMQSELDAAFLNNKQAVIESLQSSLGFLSKRIPLLRIQLDGLRRDEAEAWRRTREPRWTDLACSQEQIDAWHDDERYIIRR